ncbi:MAG: ABC transporter ATP-binding protein [Pseudomonadota bacterium]
MATIAIAGVEKSFGDTTVLSGIDIDIADGEFISLVGPSGCGKSTLLRILAGLESSDSGSISICGKPVDGLRAADRDLAMVFQSYALYPHLDVAANIAVPLRMRRLSTMGRLPLIGPLLPGSKVVNRTIADDVRIAAKAIEIDHLLSRKPGQLSGGQRQRVALARALVREPAAFLLDEPLSNLDAKLRVSARAEIAALHRRLGATFVYVTHDQVEAMTMSDRIAVMMNGRILQCDTPRAVYAAPAHKSVAEFIGTPKMSIIDGASLPGSQQGWVGLRPEAIEIARPAANDDLLAGTVTHMEDLGHEGLVHATLKTGETIVARTNPSAAREARVGELLRFSADMRQAHHFDSQGWRISPAPAALASDVDEPTKQLAHV